MSRFVFVHHYNVLIKGDKMGGADFVHGKEEKCIEGFDGNLKELRCFKNLCVERGEI